MTFNSLAFLIFLPIVFIVYWWGFKKLALQNLFILGASYFFYGWWDWRFLLLIAISTGVDFLAGQNIFKANNEHRPKSAKRWLLLSLSVNLGMLGYFKYANFFIDSWIDSWSLIGINIEKSSLEIILPVGISFYTFQTLSYTIDIYRQQLSPSKKLIDFAAFVSFFPQLVAGPIERATSLLPQIQATRKFDHNLAISGLRLIIWGLFKKVVIADTCAFYVNDVYANYHSCAGTTLLMGMVFFALQVYCDFSGYSDIAIGTARLFGIKLRTNFDTPFFSKSIPEFWNRWHISLNTWMNDYVFMPLAFALRKYRRVGIISSVVITFLLSGLWHGADWKFVVYGAIHGLAFLPYLIKNSGPVRLFTRHKKKRKNYLLNFRDLVSSVYTIIVVLVSFVFFRAESVGDAIHYLINLGSDGVKIFGKFSIILPVLVLALEWVVKDSGKDGPFSQFSFFTQIFWFSIFVFLTLLCGLSYPAHQFIYFQF